MKFLFDHDVNPFQDQILNCSLSVAQLAVELEFHRAPLRLRRHCLSDPANWYARAQRIIAEELKRRNWQPAELATRRNGDREKLTVAARLRRETTKTVAWIAARLSMGTRGYVNHLLYRRSKSRAE